MNPLNTNIHPSTPSQSLSSSSRIPLTPPKPRTRPTSLSTSISTSTSTSTSTIEARYLGIPTSPSPRSTRHRISHSTPASNTLPGPIRTAPPTCSLPNPRNSNSESHQARVSIHPLSTSLPVPDNAYNRMSFLKQEHNYLAAKVEVRLENGGVVEMIGGTQTRTSYSLPGNVVLSFMALPTPGRLRETTDLKVMFEGKSEYWDDKGRYSPLRVWSHTLNLTLPGGPILIPSHDPLRPSASTLEIAIPFQITLPGHLPASYSTTNSPSHHVSTSYGTKVQSSTAWSATSVPLRSQAFSNPSLRPESVEKSTSPYSEFTIRRHLHPSAMFGHEEVGERCYNIKPAAGSTSPVECVVGVPEWVDVYGDERSFMVTLRVKARKEGVDLGLVRKTTGRDEDVTMGEETAKVGEVIEDDTVLTYIKELAMEVEEKEYIHSIPTLCYTSTHPLPANQPTRNSSLHALMSPRHPAADPCPSLLASPPTDDIRITTTRHCLRAEDGITRNFLFSNKGLPMDGNLKRVNVVLPMPSLGVGTVQRTGSSMDSPFVKVRQSLKITMVCQNVGSDKSQIVTLLAPVKFGTSPQTLPAVDNKAVKLDEALPAYVQLFHENGVPKDNLRNLPVYNESSMINLTPEIQVPVVAIPTIPAPPKTPTPRYSVLYPAPACASSSRSSSPSRGPLSRTASPSGSALSGAGEAVEGKAVEDRGTSYPKLGGAKNSWFGRRRGNAGVSGQVD